jgi:hypothetical protein
MINRRAAIKYICALAIVMTTSRSGRRDAPSFYVAGARYFPQRRLSVGDTVVLRPVHVAGEAACRVETIGGIQIGFVPKQFVQRHMRARRAQIESLALDGVPWRWYRVS